MAARRPPGVTRLDLGKTQSPQKGRAAEDGAAAADAELLADAWDLDLAPPQADAWMQAGVRRSATRAREVTFGGHGRPYTGRPASQGKQERVVGGGMLPPRPYSARLPAGKTSAATSPTPPRAAKGKGKGKRRRPATAGARRRPPIPTSDTASSDRHLKGKDSGEFKWRKRPVDVRMLIKGSHYTPKVALPEPSPAGSVVSGTPGADVTVISVEHTLMDTFRSFAVPKTDEERALDRRVLEEQTMALTREWERAGGPPVSTDDVATSRSGRTVDELVKTGRVRGGVAHRPATARPRPPSSRVRQPRGAPATARPATSVGHRERSDQELLNDALEEATFGSAPYVPEDDNDGFFNSTQRPHSSDYRSATARKYADVFDDPRDRIRSLSRAARPSSAHSAVSTESSQVMRATLTKRKAEARSRAEATLNDAYSKVYDILLHDTTPSSSKLTIAYELLQAQRAPMKPTSRMAQQFIIDDDENAEPSRPASARESATAFGTTVAATRRPATARARNVASSPSFGLRAMSSTASVVKEKNVQARRMPLYLPRSGSHHAENRRVNVQRRTDSTSSLARTASTAASVSLQREMRTHSRTAVMPSPGGDALAEAVSGGKSPSPVPSDVPDFSESDVAAVRQQMMERLLVVDDPNALSSEEPKKVQEHWAGIPL